MTGYPDRHPVRLMTRLMIRFRFFFLLCFFLLTSVLVEVILEDPLPGKVQASLVFSSRCELLTLASPVGARNSYETFHGYPVKDARRLCCVSKLVLLYNLHRSFVASGGLTTANGFSPRFGLRAGLVNQKVDLLISPECRKIQFFADDTDCGYVSISKEAIDPLFSDR